MALTFTSVKHSVLPSTTTGIALLVATTSTIHQIYIVDEFGNTNLFDVQSDGSGQVLLQTSWFDAAKSRFQVFVLLSGVLQTMTSTLDNILSADLLLYYRRKGDFFCVSGTQTFLTGEVPVRLHSNFHSLIYN